jgi:hypothetical protein
MPATIQDILANAPEGVRDALQNPRVRRWALYFIKAIVLVGLFCLLTQFAPHMPAACVALFWAALSAVSALGMAYAFVIKKTHKCSKYTEGGLMYRFNEGRVFSLIAAFVLSAVCAAGLILEAPKWGLGIWGLVVAAIPVYAVAFSLISKRIQKEYAAPYQAASAVKWSGWIVGLLLCAAYAAIVLTQPATHFANATEAFAAAQQPFEGSPSIIMSEVGILNSFVDGLTAYGASEAAGAFFPVYVAIRIVLVASAFFGIANLLGTCALEFEELKRVFARLDASEAQGAHSSVVKRYAVIAGVLPVVLVVAFVGANAKMNQIASTSEFTAAESFVRSQASVAVAVLDGKYYDYQQVEDLIAQTEEKSAALSQEAQEKLVPLINESYDKRLENVDSYLDWYYSLPADYERLVKMVTGSAEEFVSEQFTAKIEAGIDDSAIEEELSAFTEQAEQIKAEAEAALEGTEITGVPEWLMETKATLSTDFLSEPMEPTQKLMDANVRLGVSAGAGLAAGVMTKAVTKPFFNKFVSKITTALGSRAAGAAAGGAVGTLAGPLGTIAGIAAGTALGVGVDAAMLAFDEMQNRDTYKQEIVDAIEEERAATLALVE